MIRNVFIWMAFMCLGLPLQAQRSVIVDSLYRALENASTDSAIVMLKTQLAREHIFVDVGKANELGQEAMLLAEQSGLIREKAYAMRVMGAIFRQNGVYIQGAELLLEARAIFKGFKDSLGVANCDLSLSHVHDLLGNHDMSLRMSFGALEIYRTLQNKERQGVIYNNIGRTYFDIGQLDSAYYFMERSRQINDHIANYPLLQSNYRNMGLILLEKDRPDSAKNYFHKVLKIRDSLGNQANTWATAESYMSLARIALAEGAFDEVLHYQEKAFEIASQYGYLDVLKQLMHISFNYYSSIGDQDGLVNAWNRYELLTDSILELEQRNKQDILGWYEDKLLKESEIRAYNTQIGKQRIQIVSLVAIILLGIIILIMFIWYNSKEKRINHLLNEQKKELESLNEMKNKLFSIVAHDFRGPVSQVYAFSSLLEKHLESMDIEELKRVCSDMNQSVRNTLTLTENLLFWAKNQMAGGGGSQPTRVDLKPLLEDITQLHKDQATRKSIRLEANLEAGLHIFADPEELRVVFRNLITNAIKFSNLNDTVTIAGHTAREHVVVTVKDQGLGMDEETLGTLFDLTKKTGIKGTAGEAGTGLGLVICKEFVEQNQGAIAVKSELGKGSTFTVTFSNKK